MGRYDNKTAVVTGGTSGIGLATTKLLLSEGARVIVTGRTTKTTDKARAELGERATVLPSDAASLEDIDGLAQTVKNAFGTFDLLFISAGIVRFAPFEQTSEAIYDEVFDISTKGPYFTVQKLVPLMSKGSAVVFITGIASEMGVPMGSVSGASKAAIRSLTRTLAAEFLPRGIRVNAVSPGPIDTPLLSKMGLSPEAIEQSGAQMREGNPMKRLGDANEVAKAVAFLAFEATFTTGAELPVDGGQSQL